MVIASGHPLPEPENIGEIPKAIMWGKVQYAFPGEFLGSGNRCGHDPEKPSFVGFELPFKKNPPPILLRAAKRLTQYYYDPNIIKPLRMLAAEAFQAVYGFLKKCANGEVRMNRSEAREAEINVGLHLLANVDLVTLRVGYSKFSNGEFVPFDRQDIVKGTGMSEGRVNETLERYKKSGLITITETKVKNADGEFRSARATICIKKSFLHILGVGKLALEKARKRAEKEYDRKKAEWKKKNPHWQSLGTMMTYVDRLRMSGKKKTGVKQVRTAPAGKPADKNTVIQRLKYAQELVGKGMSVSDARYQAELKYPT
ncbi:hypothetical protein [Endozoicomonas lisbonensis]|uniref:hypothetical protein n=1 Tax=Endozoicomonas lisbonensis TaxID=3120522 RepID=UPI0033983EEC